MRKMNWFAKRKFLDRPSIISMPQPCERTQADVNALKKPMKILQPHNKFTRHLKVLKTSKR